MTERWLPVVGYEGLYEVSDLGQVRSLDRIVPGRWGQQRRRGQILVQCLNPNGYWTVGLCRPEPERRFTHRTWCVHKLVARAHLGPANGRQVRHGALGQLVNAVTNLCYGSANDNAADRERDGTTARGERQGLARLTEAQVREIRQRAASRENPGGENQYVLASIFGCSQSVISQIVTRKTWTHV